MSYDGPSVSSQGAGYIQSGGNRANMTNPAAEHSYVPNPENPFPVAGNNQQYPNGKGDHSTVHNKPEHLSACGVTALVLGIVGTVLSFIPIINNLAAVLGVIGLVLGIIGLIGVFRGKKRGKALTIAGTILSVVAIVVTLAMQSATGKAIDSASKGLSSSSSQTQSSGKQNSKQTKPATGKQDTEGDLSNAHVKIASVIRSSNDYNNAQTVLVTYQWTNKTDKNQAFQTLLNAKAFQNGQELDTAIYSQPPQGYDAQSGLSQLQPNAQGTATIGYVLKDDSPVTVEVSDLFAVNSNAKVTHVYNL